MMKAPSTGAFIMSRAVSGTPSPAQALGRLPWFAAFLRRARRLRPVFPIFVLLIQHVDLTCHTRGVTRSTRHHAKPRPLAKTRAR